MHHPLYSAVVYGLWWMDKRCPYGETQLDFSLTCRCL